MPTLEEVYQKFGFAAEAAQLLETHLGTMLLASDGEEHDLFNQPDLELGTGILAKINRSTLGQLIKRLGSSPISVSDVEALLSDALRDRNRLFHSFFREHNFRRNSEAGRTTMWSDLDSIHNTLLRAYKAVMLIDGIDLDALEKSRELPTGHVDI